VVREGEGNGPIDALVHALGYPVNILDYEERAMTGGADAQAVAFAELGMTGIAGSVYGAGLHQNLVTSSILAVVSGINRLYGKLDAQGRQQLLG